MTLERNGGIVLRVNLFVAFYERSVGRRVGSSILIVGLRQKIPKKEPQIYIQKDFDIVRLSLLIYLGLGLF